MIRFHEITPVRQELSGYGSYAERLEHVLAKEERTFESLLDYVEEVGEYIDREKVQLALRSQAAPSRWLQQTVADFFGVTPWLMYAYEYIPAIRKMCGVLETMGLDHLAVPLDRIAEELELTSEDIHALESGELMPTEDQEGYLGYCYGFNVWLADTHVSIRFPDEWRAATKRGGIQRSKSPFETPAH
jgi:hypothetical protein